MKEQRKHPKKPLIIAGIFSLLFLLNANSQSRNEDPISINNSNDTLNSISLVDGDFLERSLIRELSETFRIMANVTIADSVDSGDSFFANKINL